MDRIRTIEVFVCVAELGSSDDRNGNPERPRQPLLSRLHTCLQSSHPPHDEVPQGSQMSPTSQSISSLHRDAQVQVRKTHCWSSAQSE